MGKWHLFVLCINLWTLLTDLMCWCAAIFSVFNRSSTCVCVCVWLMLKSVSIALCCILFSISALISPPQPLCFFMCKNKQMDGNAQFVASRLISCFEELCAALHFARANFSLSRVWSETAAELFTADQSGHHTSNCDFKFLKFQTDTLQPTPLLWSHLCL